MNNKTDTNIQKEKGLESNDKTGDVGQPNDEVREEAGEEFGLVSNIPPSWHTSDLRRHFMDWVEGGLFTTFHFRHRPEKGATGDWFSDNSHCCR